MYKIVLISADGKDKVTDFHNSKTIDDAWESINNMGSRWIFYPIPFVLNDNDTNILKQHIIDTPDSNLWRVFKGKTVQTVMSFIAENQDIVTAYLEI